MSKNMLCYFRLLGKLWKMKEDVLFWNSPLKSLKVKCFFSNMYLKPESSSETEVVFQHLTACRQLQKSTHLVALFSEELVNILNCISPRISTGCSLQTGQDLLSCNEHEKQFHHSIKRQAASNTEIERDQNAITTLVYGPFAQNNQYLMLF